MLYGSRLAKTLAVTGAALLAIGLSGCATADAAEDEGGDRVLRLSHFMEPAHPHEVCGIETMQEELEGSGLQVESYPSAQLGGETQALEQVYTDNLDMSINGPSFLGVYDDGFNVLDAGYLFEDGQALMEFQDSEEMEEILEGIHEESGMKVFPAWYYGVRHITANQPVEGPEDLAGLTLRTPDAPLYRITLGEMGANPTPMGLGDLYMGLQQGTVDAQENPTATLDTQSFHEVQDYLSLTGHMVQGLHISVSENVWNSLSAEEQQALEQAILAGGDAASECVFEEEEQILADYEEGDDFEVVEVETEQFAEAVREEMSSGYEYSDLYVQILESQGGSVDGDDAEGVDR